jgi:DNA-binding winged helix-turn-helix (wHTH) protein/TolB-like protein/Flp pilus assembly protein TadD
LVADDDSSGVTAGTGAVHAFGDFVLDEAAYELRRGSRRVRLARQPMELLVLLVERRGQLVSHEQIASRLWGEGVFVEVGTGIHAAIRKIRRALRDDAEAPRYIESVARRGYRFIAPVKTQEPTRPAAEPLADGRSGADAQQAAPPHSDARASPLRTEEPRSPAAGGAPSVPSRRLGVLLAIALAILAAWALSTRFGPQREERIRLAVLPFENLSQEGELDYLVHGIVEETVAALVQVDPVRMGVVGRTRRKVATDDDRRAEEVARQLGADFLVEGSMRAESDRLRLTVKLIRVRGMEQEWAASFDRARGGILGLERELASAVAEQIRLRLSPERAAALARRQTRIPEAYDLYLRGLHLMAHATSVTVLEAIGCFERAVAIDPGYALAWAAISNAHSAMPINSDAPALEAWRHARRAATRAVEIQPGMAEVQTALGRVAFFERDWRTAESALRQALAIDADAADAHLLLGHLLSQTGRHAEALAETTAARGLEPLWPLVHGVSAQVAFQARDFEGALGHARQALVVAPELWIGHMQEAQALERLGDTELALEALDRAAPLSGGNSKPISLSGYVLARSGRLREARAVLARLNETAEQRFVPPYAIALVHLGLDEHDAALEWLERAEGARDVHLVFLPVDPKWDPLRGDPRFEALLARSLPG